MLRADELGRCALAAVIAHCNALPCCDEPGSPGSAVDATAAAWAAERGVRARLRAGTFGELRGAAATEDVHAVDVVAELPASSLLLAPAAFDEPGLGDAIRAVHGVDDDTAALVWTMRQRANAASAYAPLWAALPRSPLHTGLTLPEAALAALDGTLLAEEVRQLQAAARHQYDELFPALLNAFPAAFAGSVDGDPHYSFDAYLLAAELWQAYAVRVVPPGGGAPCSALLPEVLLLNHSAQAPHVVRFSVPDADQVLRLRALRPCRAGAQLHLSYGALPNSHLLLFYGFTLRDNPHDTFPLTLELPEEEEEGQGAAATAQLRAALLERWQLGLEHTLRRGERLPSRLLGALRLLTAPADELAACAENPRHVPLSADNDQTVALTLAGTLDALLESLPPEPVQPSDAATHSSAAALGHCAVYLEGQRNILLDAQRHCADMLASCLPSV